MPGVSRYLPSAPGEFLELAWRRKWLIIVPVLVAGGVAAFVAHSLPPVYRASTTILVVKARVPESFVRSTVSSDISDRLATVTQQILSRTRLERIVLEFDLYPEARAVQPMDRVIARMRAAIEVDVLRRNNAFSVAFSGSDPYVVRDVTNALAALFIEENSKVREELAASTSEFLDAQLAALKQTLNEQEAQVRSFKERHLGSLPQQQEANLRLLDRLHAQGQNVADQIRTAAERQFALQTQLANTPRTTQVVRRVMRPLEEAASRPVVGSTSVARDPVLVRLEEARAALRLLQTRYTDEHPDVRRGKRQLEELEAQASVASQPARESGTSDEVRAGRSGATRLVPVEEVQEIANPLYEQIVAQLGVAERHLAHLRQVERDVLARSATVQQRVETVPKLEQQLVELTRDYNNTQASYQALLSKKLDAQVSENLEKRQKGEQFRVLDLAMVPQTPYRPDRRRLLAAGLALGLAVGTGGALGIEAMDRSIRGLGHLKAAAPRLPILGTVPILPDRRAARRRWAGSLLVVLLFLAAYGGAAYAAWRYRDAIMRLPFVAAIAG